MAASREKEFSEAVLFESPVAVDREVGLVKGVKILGANSKNGRSYTPKAMREAVGLYEGAKVNFDHPDKPSQSRSYRDRFGKLEHVEYREGEGLFGDLKFNPKHPLAEQFAWDAEHSPESTGLSHNAEGKTSGKAGNIVVESIDKVKSVDVVADPATNSSLYEAEEAVTVAAFLATHKSGEFPSLPILEAFGAMPQIGQAPMPGVPGQMPMQTPQVNTALKAALKAALNALMDDDSLSVDDVLRIIREKVGSVDDDFTPEEEDMAADTPPADEEDEQMVKEQIDAAVKEALAPLTEQLAAASKELAARKTLEGKGAAVTPQLLEELTGCADKAAMESLVEGWSPAKLGKEKPSIRALRESAISNGKYPETHADFLRALKR